MRWILIWVEAKLCGTVALQELSVAPLLDTVYYALFGILQMNYTFMLL